MEDFKDLKVGDSVWTIQLGDCEVISICLDANYPIELQDSYEISKSYTINGFYVKDDKFQSLFRSNPFEKKQDFEPRWMMVSDGNVTWVKRFVECSFKGNYISISNAENEEELKFSNDYTLWNYAKEIEEPQLLELTIEQIAEKFGVSVDQIKIKK